MLSLLNASTLKCSLAKILIATPLIALVPCCISHGPPYLSLPHQVTDCLLNKYFLKLIRDAVQCGDWVAFCPFMVMNIMSSISASQLPFVNQIALSFTSDSNVWSKRFTLDINLNECLTSHALVYLETCCSYSNVGLHVNNYITNELPTRT